MERNQNRAFTLIELLVVMGIIAVLITMTSFGYAHHMKSSRDTRRKLDLEEIAMALEKYHIHNHAYPNDLAILHEQGYILELPQDPLSPQQSYEYTYDSNTDGYELRAEMEQTSKGTSYFITPQESGYEGEEDNQ